MLRILFLIFAFGVVGHAADLDGPLSAEDLAAYFDERIEANRADTKEWVGLSESIGSAEAAQGYGDAFEELLLHAKASGDRRLQILVLQVAYRGDETMGLSDLEWSEGPDRVEAAKRVLKAQRMLRRLAATAETPVVP